MMSERYQKELCPIHFAGYWATIYHGTPFFVECAHVLEVGFAKTRESGDFFLKFLADGLENSFAPHVVARILGHILPHAIVEREHFVVDGPKRPHLRPLYGLLDDDFRLPEVRVEDGLYVVCFVWHI